MEEEPKNITHTDELKGPSSKRKPRTKKDGNLDQRSIKNQKNMSHARSELQKYIHAGKAEKTKTKKEEPEEAGDSTEEEIEVIFKSPSKVKQPENTTKENKKSKVKELEELIGRYHSELSRISEKHKKLKKKKVVTPPPPPPTPTPPPPTPYSTIGNDLRKKFLLRF